MEVDGRSGGTEPAVEIGNGDRVRRTCAPRKPSDKNKHSGGVLCAFCVCGFMFPAMETVGPESTSAVRRELGSDCPGEQGWGASALGGWLQLRDKAYSIFNLGR